MRKPHNLDRHQHALVQCGHLDVCDALLVPFNYPGNYFTESEPRRQSTPNPLGNFRRPLPYSICMFTFAVAGLLWRAFQGDGRWVLSAVAIVLFIPVLGVEAD